MVSERIDQRSRHELGFLVRRTDLRERMDVSFALAGRSVLETSEAPGLLDGLTTLGALITEVRYGTSVRATSDGPGTPMLRMGNIKDGAISTDSIKYVQLDPKDYTRLKLRKGDLLVNRTNTKELVGKAAVFSLPGDWVYASYLIRLRLDPETADPDFVAAWLSTPHARGQINQLSRQSAGQTNINTEEIRALRIPRLPLQTQRRLVAPLLKARRKLDETQQQVMQLRAGLDDAYREMLGLAALGVRVANAQLGQVVDSATLADSGRLDVAYFHPERLTAVQTLANGAYPAIELGDAASIVSERADAPSGRFVGLAAVEGNTGRFLDDQVGSDGGETGLRFSPGDVLFGRLRPNLNKVWVADREGVCSPEFRVLRPKGNVRADYLAIALRSPFTVMQTTHAASGNTHPRLTDADLLEVRVTVPDPNHQARIATELAALVGNIERLTADSLKGWKRSEIAFAREITSLLRGEHA